MKISWKIFGVALIVFTVMAASSVYTIFKIFEINRELASISNVFAPVTNELARIEAVALNEELHVERIAKIEAELRADRLEALAAGKTDAEIQAEIDKDPELKARIHHLEERLAVEMEVFEARAREVQALIEHAEKLVKNGQSIRVSLADQLQLAALYPSLVAIEGQHSTFHKHAKTLVTATNLTSAVREQLEEQLEAEEDALAKRIEEVWQQIAGFTDQAIRTAAAHEQQAFYASIGATASAGILALLLSYIVIIGILRPMRELANGAKQVEEGDLSVQITPRSRDEIGSLASSFNSMVEGLRSTEKIKDTFGQYLDPRVVSNLIGDNQAVVAGEKKIVSAYFSDLADFSKISEQFTPAGLVKVLNRYLDLMSVPVTERKGVIDKYIGDAIMAFWTTPFCEEGDQAKLAVSTALANMQAMAAFQKELPDLTGLQRNLPVIHQRIGIATGEAVIGSIGSARTKNYTIMGDTVNLGARLEGANKSYGTGILVCERTRDMAAGFAFRLVDRIQVVGKTEATHVYTPFGATNAVGEAGLQLMERSEEAFGFYAERRFSEAQTAYRAILALAPEDPVSRVFLNRLSVMAEQGVPDNWDGIWRMTSK